MLESNQLHGLQHDFYHVCLALLLNMKLSRKSYETVIHSLRLFNKYFQDSLNKKCMRSEGLQLESVLTYPDNKKLFTIEYTK